MATVVERSLIGCGCGCGCDLSIEIQNTSGLAVGCGYYDEENTAIYATIQQTLTCRHVLTPGHPDYSGGGNNNRQCTTTTVMHIENPVWVGGMGETPEACDVAESECDAGSGCEGLGQCGEEDPGFHFMTGCDPADVEPLSGMVDAGSLIGEAAAGATTQEERVLILGEDTDLLFRVGLNEYLVLFSGFEAQQIATGFSGEPWSLIRPSAAYVSRRWRFAWNNEKCGSPFKLRYTLEKINDDLQVIEEEEIDEDSLGEAMGWHDLDTPPGWLYRVKNIYITFTRGL